ncbi:MAG: hypothetical protein ACWGOL_09085, partial [Desulfuromonadales bacterium]
MASLFNEKYCASCHRPFAQTTKPQRSVGRLRSAIKAFPSMNNLDFLSEMQLEAMSSKDRAKAIIARR